MGEEMQARLDRAKKIAKPLLRAGDVEIWPAIRWDGGCARGWCYGLTEEDSLAEVIESSLANQVDVRQVPGWMPHYDDWARERGENCLRAFHAGLILACLAGPERLPRLGDVQENPPPPPSDDDWDELPF